MNKKSEISSQNKPRLLEQVRDVLRYLHYSYRTEQSYIHWIKRYIYFHNKKHPRDMGPDQIVEYLTYLAVKRKVSPSTQNQALSALLFLYKQVLKVDLPWLDNIKRGKRKKYISAVLLVPQH